jgi:proprotein convertase subtilisin/kexin type 5
LDERCLPCHPSCLECSKAGSQSCTKCGNHKDVLEKDIPLFLHSGVCLKACPPGTYVDVTSQVCKPCASPCSTCIGSGNEDCLSCVSGLYRLGGPNGSCIQVCPHGKYVNNT